VRSPSQPALGATAQDDRVTETSGDPVADHRAQPRAGSRATMEVHFKLFGTDGVSLQSQELSTALRARGWSVHPCACDVPAQSDGLRLPELSYQSPDAVELRGRIFPPAAEHSRSSWSSAGEALVEEISDRARPIRRQVEAYLDSHTIPVLHIRNLMSLPYNLPATLAFHDLAVDRPDLGFLMQHHDLYWEGPNATNFQSPYREITDLMDRIMCPSLPNARHVVINPIAADALRVKKRIEATVVPDGFDFDRDVAVIDQGGFRSRLEILAGDGQPLGTHDLVVAMPARVAINKAIELAIQFVAGLERKRLALQDVSGGIGVQRRRFGPASRIALLLPQGEDLDDNRDYFERLVAYAKSMRITLAYGGNVVVPDRRSQPGDPDHYPFYSTYQAVDMVCYPPEHEGFGNQAIEAVWARRPLAVLEYPVFKRYVRDHIPHYISLGDVAQLGRLEEFGGLHQLSADVLDPAVDAAITVLKDHDLERKWTDENFTVLREFCGIGTVAATYMRLYGDLGAASPS
jgi:mannosylglucosylglycerate synthase